MANTGSKICPKCGSPKWLNATFCRPCRGMYCIKCHGPITGTTRSPNGYCLTCRSTYFSGWAARPGNRDKLRARDRANYPQESERRLEQRRWAKLRAAYGITREQYMHLLNSQQGGCAICGQLPSGRFQLAVDHCAVTGRIRGLLCNPCNLGIGQLGHDPARLQRASSYLQEGGHHAAVELFGGS